MLKFKSMSGISRTIKEAEAYRDHKELLKALAKYLPVSAKLSKWIEIDKEMGDRPLADLVPIFQRVLSYDFPWMLGLHPGPIIKPWEIVSNDKVRTLPIWSEFGRLLTDPDNVSKRTVLLFRLNRLGIWVMHNMSPPTGGVYVCIPAQRAGNNNIIIEPLQSWAEREFHD